MSALEKRYRRNFVVAVVLHVVLVVVVVIIDKIGPFGNQTSQTEIFEAAILGDLPVGDGYGLGKHREAEPVRGPAAKAEVKAPVKSAPTPPSGPTAPSDPIDESKPADKVSNTKIDPDAVTIQQKNRNKKPVVEPKKPATETKSAGVKPTAQNSNSNSKTKTVVNNKSATTGASNGASAEDIKKRLGAAFGNSSGGNVRGDDKTAGGGTGKGKLGYPDGKDTGVLGGTGQGSKYADYYRHIHDVMYDAWSQSGAGLDKKLLTTVMLRIGRDGSVMDVSLAGSSGSKAMDESVLNAARKVPRLDPPPSGLVNGDVAKVSVEFQVEG